ncbi:DUF2079 domain-containing protein [Natrarchaeobius halalkaliphilus]|uniref:DUF2079 domain-containing protein n=1 Tax=Natrarchaeobius halalkaliphilus TaxID=1679091 RepID=A0A3N6M9P3_9EURY|nr:GtrA family protein [Natrarchaeobius halalkaliphilus]RQG93020.1 DUF2079 domain-containing protein [Natrarchaeobius halalkaliphilus]
MLGDVLSEQWLTPRNKRVLKYATVGLVGVGVNEVVLFVSVAYVGVTYVTGGILSRIVSILTNYALNDHWTWRGRGGTGRRKYVERGGKYVGTRIVGILIGISVLIVLVEAFGMHYLLANLVAIGAGFLWGFGISERWVWRPRSDDPLGSELRRVSGQRISAVRTRIRAAGRAIHARRHELAVVGLSVAVGAALTAFLLLQHRAYLTSGSDLGAYVQMFSTTASGDGWLEHGKYRIGHPMGSYWGAHFSATLLVFLVPFAIAPGPETLLVVKSVVLALSIPAFWYVASEAVDDRNVALVLVVSYAGNPFLWSAWLFDFQEQILLPILVFASYYFYKKRRYGGFLVSIALILLTNEFLVPLVAGYLSGLALASHRANRLRAERSVFLAGFGLVAAVKLLAEAVMARFSVATGIPLASVADPVHAYTDQWRLSITDLLQLYLTNPQLLLESATYDLSTKVTFVLLLLLPVFFLSLLDESAVAAVAPFFAFAWIFAGRTVYYEFGAHYPFYLLPFLYIGATRALASGRARRLRRLDWRTLLAAVLVVNLLVGLALGPAGSVPSQSDRTERLDAAIESVPEDETVVTQNDIYPHVATNPGASYVVRSDMFREYDRLYGPIEPEYVLVDRTSPWDDPVEDGFGDRLHEEYAVYRYEDGTIVYKRGYDGDPRGITKPLEISRTYAPSEFSSSNAELYADRLESSMTVASDEQPRLLWYGPYDELPPGTYEATFLVDVTTESDLQLTLDVAAGEGPQVVSSTDLDSTGGAQEVTVRFELDRPSDVELRGFQAGGDGTVEFHGGGVELVSPSGDDRSETLSGDDRSETLSGDDRSGAFVYGDRSSGAATDGIVADETQRHGPHPTAGERSAVVHP